MKRSEINGIMRDAESFLAKHEFHLPPFASWGPDDWAEKGEDVSEIVEHQLGWDITDFGQGGFHKVGLLLFTLRNGAPDNLEKRQGKLYAEKIMIVDPDQVTPMHFHWLKMEDIINRAGGQLVIQLYNSTPDEGMDEGDVTVSVDGIRRAIGAGETIVLSPGQSVSLPPRLYHKFWGADDRVLVGEVSLVNDDKSDNRFYESVGRFPEIEEDEAPLHCLVSDYRIYYRAGA